MCSLRDAATDFDKHNVRVFGVSLDDVQTIAAFAKAQHLEFPLLSDPDGGVATKYGVMMVGRPFSKRASFVIDDQGVVRHVDLEVDALNHGRKLIELLAKLRG